jgi:hypothetical protein
MTTGTKLCRSEFHHVPEVIIGLTDFVNSGEDQYIKNRVLDPDPRESVLNLEAGSGSVLKYKFRSFRGSKGIIDGGLWTLKMEA